MVFVCIILTMLYEVKKETEKLPSFFIYLSTLAPYNLSIYLSIYLSS